MGHQKDESILIGMKIISRTLKGVATITCSFHFFENIIVKSRAMKCVFVCVCKWRWLEMRFILSSDVAKYIAEASMILPFHTGFPEDAIVALWLIGTKTVRYNTLIHYMSGDLWNAIDEKGLLDCG
jgi:hypothetical protein